MSHYSLADLDARARHVFRDIVDSYVKTGEAVGSKTLALKSKDKLSPATIRNVMAELSGFGLIESAHVSAGRIPTQAGLRLFVDGLLEVGDVSKSEQQRLEAELAAQGRDPSGMLEQASTLLAGLAGGAGLVLTPTQKSASAGAVNHVEFISLDSGQALVVIVYANGRVENRLMPRPQGLLPLALEQAGHFLSNRLKGRRLDEARTDILEEIRSGQAAIDAAAAKLIQQGLADWSGTDKTPDRKLIVRGQSQLLQTVDLQADLERIQQLFDDIERKEGLIALLDQAEEADGVTLFIGSENPLFSLSGSSVVIAPYRNAQKNIIGAVGVIGPTRLNYARIIPMVDYTAQLIGRMLD